MPEGRRGNIETHRRAREMQFFGDRDKVFQVTEFHGPVIR